MFIGPLDFWDTLAATDWSRRFESFEDDQLWQLHRYRELADELGKSSFFAQPVNFSFKASAEESYQRLDHAGADALRSMAMSFRQLWETGEPARFQTIRDLLHGHALDTPFDTVVLLDQLGKRYRTARRLVMMKEVWADDPVGEPKHVIRSGQVIEDWLYSGPFHAKKDKIERVKRWSTTSYEFCLVKAIHAVVGVMWELHIVVMGVTAGQPAAA